MKGLKRLLIIIFGLVIALIALFFSGAIYNSIPSLEKTPKIETVSNQKKHLPQGVLKVISYNIHFATGLNDKQVEDADIEGLKKRLDQIADVLNKADADIVLLQEVDINSSRSYKINQGQYLANKSSYNYYACASLWRMKVFPDINGRHGILEHGLCILSKFPLLNHEAQIFSLSKSIPFFLKWLFNPHGIQKVDVNLGGKIITVVNLHLDPWSPQERELQMKNVINWINATDHSIVLGGDLNLEPPYTSFKTVCHLQDKPWFISLDQERLQNEKTLIFLKKNGFQSCIDSEKYLKNPKAYYSYPSNDPKVKLDYIFSNNLKIINGYIFHEAKDASDHLPIIADLKL